MNTLRGFSLKWLLLKKEIQMNVEFNFFKNSCSKFKIKFAVVSRAVKVTRDNVVRGEVARGYVAPR
jgi:hypothetical protein